MNETAIVPYVPPSQEFNLQEEVEKVITDEMQNNAPEDDEVAYLEHDKSLNENSQIGSDNEKFSSDAQPGSGSSSEDEKSNKDFSGQALRIRATVGRRTQLLCGGRLHALGIHRSQPHKQ